MSKFGVARLAHEYESVTNAVTSAASDMGQSLQDLKEHAARFSQAFSITRRSDVIGKTLTLRELLENKNGIVSLHEAFAGIQGADRMRFVSAAKWLSDLKRSDEMRLEGDFLTLSGFEEVNRKSLDFIKREAKGVSLLELTNDLGFDVPLAKEVVRRLIAKGKIAVDESIEGIRYHENLFIR